jgi:hypothetical protein
MVFDGEGVWTRHVLFFWGDLTPDVVLWNVVRLTVEEDHPVVRSGAGTDVINPGPEGVCVRFGPTNGAAVTSTEMESLTNSTDGAGLVGFFNEPGPALTPEAIGLLEAERTPGFLPCRLGIHRVSGECLLDTGRPGGFDCFEDRFRKTGWELGARRTRGHTLGPR